jgi:hypothetical protein
MNTNQTIPPTFPTGFDAYACEGDTLTVEINGIEYTATIVRDDHSHIDDDDCHNPDQEVTGCNKKQHKKLMEARQSWRNDEWFYGGIVISARKNSHEISDHLASLWAVEINYPDTDNAYLLDVANELLGQAVPQAEEDLESLIESLKG